MRFGGDWGHGGENRGTTAGGIVEKEMNRTLGTELIHSLPYDRITPEILRVDDEDVSLADRGVRSTSCKWVMSIHCNAHQDSRMCGAEVYVLPGPGRLKERLAAKTILACMPDELRPGRLRVADPNQAHWLQQPYNVLSPHVCHIILVEVCYASNPAELAVLMSNWGRMAIVSALRAGVARMLQLEEEE